MKLKQMSFFHGRGGRLRSLLGRAVLLGMFFAAAMTPGGLAAAAPARVACVGDSLTYGYGSSSHGTKSYPSVLQSGLGKGYLVKNFGVCGATVLKKGNKPYWNTKAYRQSLADKPQIVVLMLGTNDSKPVNWAHRQEFSADYCELIRSYQRLVSDPVVYIATSPATKEDDLNIRNSVIHLSIVPLQKRAAKELGCRLIDLNADTQKLSIRYYIADKIHFNDRGYLYLASHVAEILRRMALHSAFPY